MLNLQRQIVNIIFFRDFRSWRVFVGQLIEVVQVVDDFNLHDLLVETIVAFFCNLLDLSFSEGELLRLVWVDIFELVDD